LVVKSSSKKHAAPKKTTSKSIKSSPKKSDSKERMEEEIADQDTKKSSRPIDEVVTYEEVDFELKEITPQGNKVLIGPPWLTRFERARITGARSLQLSLGAPPLIKVPTDATSSIMLSVAEIEQKALPISIRRILPNGAYQDIPIDWMK
jgi:DNA-directed RNA polymerase I, II, and III subunit RPABC2